MQNAVGDINENSPEGTIPQNEAEVKRKFSLSSDSDGKQLTKEQADINKNRDLALEKFGTTSNFAQTGFVLPDGKMLNLSQYGQNGVQHKRTESIYDNVKGYEAIISLYPRRQQ